MAEPEDANPAGPPEEVPAHRNRHTGVQRAILVLNVVVVLACFAGAGALIVGKRVRESFVAAPKVTYLDTAATTAEATTTVPDVADDPAPSVPRATTGPTE